MDEKAFDKKFKRLMTKTSLKGMFKKVDTLDKCDVVLVMYYDEPNYESFFATKKEFKEKILCENNEINTDNDFALQYLKYSNPRHAANKLPNKLLDRAFSRKNIFFP